MSSHICLREASECGQLSMESNWGAHSTFPSFPVSLPSGKGEAGSYPHPALKLGKLNFCVTLLVSMVFSRESASTLSLIVRFWLGS
jgi:hypothetical protein